MQYNTPFSRFRWLGFILFFLLIYIEITIFVAVADELGVLATLLLTFLTSVLGVSLVKNEGLRNLMQIQQKLAGNQDPAKEVIKSFALLISGVLLFLPGFFTDFLGLFLLIPFVQGWLVGRLLPNIKVMKQQKSFWKNGEDSTTFDAEFTKKTDIEGSIEHKKIAEKNDPKNADSDTDKQD